MDNQTQSFLELSAKNDLIQLVADKRAAWLWSADGARILWANAAGALFFSAQSIPDIAGLTSLERSPARPHIARIATSGLADRFTIDRLRFYRGLRVMLLTCQCKKVVLENGENAALIVCGDKGLTLTKDPIVSFAHLIKGAAETVFLLSDGTMEQRIGLLEGKPEDLDLPQSQRVLFGPLDLNGSFHEGAILQIPAGPKLFLLDDNPVSGDTSANSTGNVPSSAASGAPPVTAEESNDFAQLENSGTALDNMPDEASGLAGDALTEEAGAGAAAEDTLKEDPAPQQIETGRTGEAPDTDEVLKPHSATADQGSGNDGDVTAEEPAGQKTGGSEEVTETSAETGDNDIFVFQPRRRPTRFAWKMDVDQRFTFLSDEFAEVLGPGATALVGQTWDDVSKAFDLDPRENIARALDRRDTWSGKTVNWPVSGAPLRVPVDMAALPAFDRDRKFEGYRGFGVCRSADAVQDPDNPILVPQSANGPDIKEDAAGIAEPETRPLPEEEPNDEKYDPADADTGLDSSSEDPSVKEKTSAPPDALEPVIDDAEDSGATIVELSEISDEAKSSNGQTASDTETLEGLKPMQPDSLAGKTFLGASAAALVGSLAKFTGKSGTPAGKDSKSASNDVDLTEDLQSAAAALDGSSNENNSEAADTISGEQLPVSTDAEQETAGGNVAEEPPEENAQDRLEPEELLSEPADNGPAPVDVEDRQEAPREPTGISGTAELKPAEIESAVKTLQKSYNASGKLKAPDLFENEPTTESIPDEEASPDGAADDNASVADTRVRGGDALSDDTLDGFSPEEASIETGDTEDPEEAAPDGPEETDPDNKDIDESDFYEETATFKQENRDAAENAEKASEPEPVKTGEVIPLATARPRVVPVDTSSLSRPERQAFRKIAEALGARLGGDLKDFESPDTEGEEVIEELPPEIPEAGPIDPSLLDRLPIGIAIVHDREVLYANKALLRMLGYKSISSLSEAGGLEALFIDDAEELTDAIGMDDEVDETMKMRLSDGGVLNVDAHMHLVPWNDSRGLMISITERPVKQAATSAAPAFEDTEIDNLEELSSARIQIAEMDTILETATDGVLVLDQHGTIVKVNGSAEALFSANRVDMIGAPLTEFMAPESHRAAADYLDGLSRNGVASILNDGREVLGKVPSGGLIPLFMTIGRITSGKEDVKYCAVLRDITQWKTAEEELTQAKRQAENANSQKSDFLAKISHEIRTPLNAIIGFSEVMMEERFGPIGNDRYKDYLKDIRTSGSHIMSLINDLLDLSKIEAGKLDLNFSAVSSNDVINECVALMQPQANRERVIIRASLPESVPDVVADPRSLRQIVLNLLSNAIKYNKSGGQVILSTALESNGEVALRVRDTGTGMTAKQLAAALEPFRQLHTSSRGGGTGLGLPLTKALVEANRAAFHIDSTPDQGTLVEIVFPTQRVLSE